MQFSKPIMCLETLEYDGNEEHGSLDVAGWLYGRFCHAMMLTGSHIAGFLGNSAIVSGRISQVHWREAEECISSEEFKAV